MLESLQESLAGLPDGETASSTENLDDTTCGHAAYEGLESELCLGLVFVKRVYRTERCYVLQ